MRLRVRLCLFPLILVFVIGILQTTVRSDEPASNQLLDRPAPPFGSILASAGAKCANPDERLPPELGDELKAVFRELAPGATVKLDEKELTADFHCQKYQIYPHTRGKGGDPSQKPREVFGPTDRGFLLKIVYREERYSGQAQSFNGESREHYWNQSRKECTLPNERGYLWTYYSFGTLTDTKLLTGITAAIEKAYGMEAGVLQIVGADMPRCRVDEIIKSLESSLTYFLRERQLEATVKLENRELVVSRRTQEFQIYDVGLDGRVATDPHVETGPLDDGFIIKIRGVQRRVRAEELPRYGESFGPYWRRYWNSITTVWPGQRMLHPYDGIRIEISYGTQADRQLFRELEEHMNQFGKLAIRGQFER